jgi:hypothetical protein
MLEGVRQFLVAHPGEVLAFVIEDYVTPADVAAAFRESGLERLCQRERARLPNILAVDFAMTGDVVGVAAELNGLAPAPERSAP